ncbi:MAG: glycosyltransferase [Gammaproteobacteria bacterium]|nr:glycosyltransferase [Gammaproteobacteria bacterium]
MPRTFIHYEDLLENWQDTCARIASELGVIWPNSPDSIKDEANAFLDSQLRHHRREIDQLADTSAIAKWSKKLYLALQHSDRDISSLIDRIYADIAPAEAMLAPMLQDTFRQLKQIEHSFAESKSWGSELDTNLKKAQQEFNRLSLEFDEKTYHVGLLQDETAQLKASLSSAANALDARNSELKNTQQAFKQLADESDTKSLHVSMLLEEAAQLKASLSSAENALDARNIELKNTQQAFKQLADESDAKSLHVSTLLEEAAQLKDSLAATQELLVVRTTELQDSKQKLSASNSTNQAGLFLLQGATRRITEADAAIHTLIAAQGQHKRRAAFWKRNKDLRLLENTPLFDSAFYLSSHPEVLSSGFTPQEHYLKLGAGRGWDPHLLFSTSWYLEKYRDVAQRGMNPLVHFLRCGAKEKRSPHPLFDIELYQSAYPQAATSGMNALEHYLQIGGPNGFRPHWLFDGKAYLEAYPEVRETGSNPLLHYLQIGHLKNYRPHWAFDPTYYLGQIQSVVEPGVPALLHFVTKGAKLRMNPSAEFDTAAFLQQYPFLESCNENPLEYYVQAQDNQAVFNPPALSSPITSVEVPTTPIHNEEPGSPLPAFMDFLYDEFGEVLRTEIISRMQRFHLPFTSEKIAPKPAENDIPLWLEEIHSLSNAAPTTVQPDVSIVIPVYNQLPFTLACIHSVLSSRTNYSYEIIVADDRSTDRTTDIFSQGVGRIRHVLGEQNQGFIRNCNNAAKHARGRYLVLLNNDTIVLPGWLDELIGTLDTDPDIGLVGSKLLYPDGRLQESGGIIFGDGSGWNYGRMDDPRKPQYCYMRDADYVSGASIALRTEFWNDVGGFDERYSVAYYEDTDMAFRVRQAGLRVVVQPLSQLLHFEGISSGTDTSSGAKQYQLTNAVIFKDKWSGMLADHGQCDPKRLPADRTTRYSILVVDACTPTPDRDAGSLETFQHLRILRSFGFHVVFAPENLAYFGRYTQDLQRMGIETLYAPYWMSFEEVLKKLGSSFELVMIYRAPVANRLIDLVRNHAPQAKIIIDTIDLHFLREEREAALHNDPEKVQTAAATRRKELNIIEHADATIILSSHEMGIVQDLLPKAKLYEIPIVCKTPGKGPLSHSQRKDIVFIGGFRHAPNLDAVKWFVSDVWPHLLAKGFTGNFHIVGADMPNEITRMHGAGIIVRGHVPDIADVFNEVRVSVAPLRFGAGLKGKVISSLSFGVPVVATSVAVEGGGFTHEGNVLVTDDPETFADSIIRLYDDPLMWENLSQNGVAHCNRSFSVSVVTAKFRHLINDIAPELKLEPDE